MKQATVGNSLSRRTIPCLGEGIPCSAPNRESSAAHWNCSANGRRSPRKAPKWPEISDISLLFPLLSGKCRPLLALVTAAPPPSRPRRLVGADVLRPHSDSDCPCRDAAQ